MSSVPTQDPDSTELKLRVGVTRHGSKEVIGLMEYLGVFLIYSYETISLMNDDMEVLLQTVSS